MRARAQSPTGTGEQPKKRDPVDETSAASPKVLCVGCGQLQERYEVLRHLALETNRAEISVSDGLELAFLERQGVAAWMETCLAGSLPAVVQEVEMQEPVTPPDGLVLALVDLVVGDRVEVKDD